QRIVEHGWPAESRMELRRPPRAASPSTTERQLARTMISDGFGDSGGQSIVQRLDTPGDGVSSGPGRLPTASLTERLETSAPPAAPAGPNVDRLARGVYAILKAQLRAERDRDRV